MEPRSATAAADAPPGRSCTADIELAAASLGLPRELFAQAAGLEPREPGRHVIGAVALGHEQAIGLGHRQAAQDDRIQQREHGGRAADPERQRRDGDGREHWTSTEEPQTEPDILENIRQHGTHGGINQCNRCTSMFIEEMTRNASVPGLEWSIPDRGCPPANRP